MRNDISARRETIRYPAFRARGWQIGSGPMESQSELCTNRLKGHAAGHDRPNATVAAALDTMDRNGPGHKFRPNASPTVI